MTSNGPPTSAEIIAAVADDLPLGVWVARAPSGEEVYANRTFAEILGVGVLDAQVGGYAQPYGIFTRDGELYPESRMPFVRALESGETVVVDDLVIHRPDGQRVNIRAQARPIKDAAGTITHVIIAFIDVTREVEAEQARDRFLSVASHELRSPLGALQMRLQGLVEIVSGEAELARDTLRDWLGTASRQARRLGALVDRLLDGSRLRAGRFDVALERCDLATVIRDAVARHHAEAEAGGADVVLIDPPPLIGMWDPLRVEQVIGNLLSNATKYGDGKPVHVVAQAVGDRVRVEVRDQGIGIAVDQQRRIFAAYERAVSERHYAGLGLGLWIAHQIVLRLNGVFTVESEPGHGATFTFELPWQR